MNEYGSFYELTLKVKSPLILAKKLYRKIYVSESDFISGSRIRGAVLTYLYEQGITDIKNESVDPRVIFSPAYPVLRREDKPMIGHAFCFYSKLDAEKRVFSTLREVKSLKDRLKKNTRELFPLSPSDSSIKGVIKSAMGKPLVREKGSWKVFSIEMFEIESTAIDKNTGRAHSGMVFGYEAIPVGALYKGYVYDQKDILSNNLGLKNTLTFEVLVGRGGSRGFGRCEVELRKIDYSKRLAEIRKFVIDNSFVVFMAYSPFSLMNDPLTFTVAPETIESNSWINFNGKLDIYQFTDEFGEKHVAAFGRERDIISYSLLANMRRPVIRAACPGSLYVYDIEGDLESISRALFLAEMKGFSMLSTLGIGIIRVLDKDFIGE